MSNKSGTDLINEAKQRIREVSAADVKRALDSGKKPVLLDVREPNETNLGRIPGAIVIPRGTMEGKIEAAVPRDAELVVYCAGGNRSALAADTLQQMGYTNVASMAGGWGAWVSAGGPVEG
ncbi:MAG TPA: rhodanese-like domain-containing protein [Gemmatimonadaceae bacterium]|nr:rhodanese-like domain-containing protein [Gemmatimonadaceae bacterium]